MNIISNMQINPVDIDKYNEMTILEEVTIVAKSLEKLWSVKTKEVDLKVVDYLPDITDEDWHTLYIFRPYEPLVIDRTDGRYKKDVASDILYIDKTQEKVKTTNKMVVLSDGVLMMIYATFAGREILFDAIKAALSSQKVVFTCNANDIYINGKKFCGKASPNIGNKYRMNYYMITFNYNDALFKKALPEVLYSREYADGSKEPGITGIKQHYPDFDVNVFVQAVIDGVTNDAII